MIVYCFQTSNYSIVHQSCHVFFRIRLNEWLLFEDEVFWGIIEISVSVCLGGRVGRDFQNSNVIIYLPKKPSELFNKMIDTSFDIKDILANKELQSELNIDVSNINYFNILMIKDK